MPPANHVRSIRTPRMWLRPWEPGDAAGIGAMFEASREHLCPWIPWADAAPCTEAAAGPWIAERAERFAAGEDLRYGMLSGSRVLGEAMLSTRVGPGALEVGYLVSRLHVGRGYATEAAAALVRVGFELAGAERMELRCSPDNAPSIAIARRLGFRLDRTLPDHFRGSDGVLQDSMVWILARGAPRPALAVTCFDADGEPLELPGDG